MKIIQMAMAATIIFVAAGCTGGGGDIGAKRMSMSEARATVLANQGRRATATAIAPVGGSGVFRLLDVEQALPYCERQAVGNVAGSIVVWPGMALDGGDMEECP